MLILTKWIHRREQEMDKIDLFEKYKPCTIIDTVFMNYRHYKKERLEGMTIIEASTPKFRDFKHIPFDTFSDAVAGLQSIKDEIDVVGNEIVFIRNIDDFPYFFPVYRKMSFEMDDETRDDIKKSIIAIKAFINSFPDKKLVLLSNVREKFGKNGYIAGDYEMSRFESWDVKFDKVIETWNAQWWEDGSVL